MITYTTREIEESRRDAIKELLENDKEATIQSLEDNSNGELFIHEVLHGSSIVSDMHDRHLLSHVAIVMDPEAYKFAHEASTALFNLYQYLGGKRYEDLSIKQNKENEG